MSATAMIQDVMEGRARWCVVEGNCVDVLPTIPAKAAESQGLSLKDARAGQLPMFGEAP